MRLNEVVNFLKKSSDYNFHLAVWNAYFSSHEVEQKDVYEMLVDPENDKVLDYFVELKYNVKSKKYSPLLESIMTNKFNTQGSIGQQV